MWRPHPKGARVNPASPQAWGTCDRCGFIKNLADLNWQYDWQGPRMQNLRLLVCKDTGGGCLDAPSEAAKRTIIIPPDPPPVFNARPEQYAIDEGLMPLTTTPAYPGDPGQVVRTDDGKYIGVEPP